MDQLGDNEHPVLEMADLEQDVGLGAKLVTMVCQKNLLDRLLRGGGAPNEIIQLAKKINCDLERRCKAWEKRILEERIRKKGIEIRRVRREWEKASRKVERVLEGDLLLAYKNAKKSELRITWQREKANMEKKVRDKVSGVKVPEELEGVPVADRLLQEKCGTPEVEGLVLGGLEVSDNVRAFLRLPPKFRVLPEPSLREAEIGAEEAAAKQRYSRLGD